MSDETLVARASRIPGCFAVVVRPEAGAPVRGYTLNVSRGGVGVTASHAFAPGTRVALEFDPRDGGTSVLQGTVVWSRHASPVLGLGSYMGVRVESSDAHNDLLLEGAEGRRQLLERLADQDVQGRRRRLPRYAVGLEAGCLLEEHPEQLVRLVDVSANGARLALAVALAPGTVVRLAVTLSAGTAVVNGEVRWSRLLDGSAGATCGVRLTAADDLFITYLHGRAIDEDPLDVLTA